MLFEARRVITGASPLVYFNDGPEKSVLVSIREENLTNDEILVHLPQFSVNFICQQFADSLFTEIETLRSTTTIPLSPPRSTLDELVLFYRSEFSD